MKSNSDKFIEARNRVVMQRRLDKIGLRLGDGLILRTHVDDRQPWYYIVLSIDVQKDELLLLRIDIPNHDAYKEGSVGKNELSSVLHMLDEPDENIKNRYGVTWQMF